MKSLKSLQQDLEMAKSTWSEDREIAVNGFDNKRILGEALSVVVYGYYGKYNDQTDIRASKYDVTQLAMPIMGTFGYEPYQRTLFGLNRGIEVHGMFMNIYVANLAQHKSGDRNNTNEFMQEAGMLSSVMEHSIPEEMFYGISGERLEGFSTAKALSKAIGMGQRIYTLTEDNSSGLSQIRLDANSFNEIRSALAMGNQVTAHTDIISVPSFKGSGYVIIDPETGVGVYKISGGKNGGVVGLGVGVNLGLAFMSVVNGNISSLAGAGKLLLNPVVAVILLSVTILLSMFSIMDSIQFGEQRTMKCFLKGLITGFSIGATLSTEKKNLAIKAILIALGISASEYGSLPSLRECGILP